MGRQVTGKSKFGKIAGMRFIKIGTCTSKRKAELKMSTLMRNGQLAMVEPESIGRYNIYRKRN